MSSGKNTDSAHADSGCRPDVRAGCGAHTQTVPSFLLEHRHDPRECGAVFASFKGHPTHLRHRSTLASCRSGGHAIWWKVEAASERDALLLLPQYVADRTSVARVSDVEIP